MMQFYSSWVNKNTFNFFLKRTILLSKTKKRGHLHCAEVFGGVKLHMFKIKISIWVAAGTACVVIMQMTDVVDTAIGVS